MTMKSMMIAAGVAGMFAVGATGSASADKKGGEVMCEGVNGCKGHGACKGSGHSCAGKNGCKGQGFTKTTMDDCLAKGGKVQPAAKQ